MPLIDAAWQGRQRQTGHILRLMRVAVLLQRDRQCSSLHESLSGLCCLAVVVQSAGDEIIGISEMSCVMIFDRGTC